MPATSTHGVAAAPLASRGLGERRRHRASTPSVALGIYLEAVARTHDLDALIVSEDSGWLVGSSRRELDLERLASVGRRCAEGRDAGAEEFIAAGGDDLYAHEMPVPGRRLFLTSVGRRVPSVREVARTAARILG